MHPKIQRPWPVNSVIVLCGIGLVICLGMMIYLLRIGLHGGILALFFFGSVLAGVLGYGLYGMQDWARRLLVVYACLKGIFNLVLVSRYIQAELIRPGLEAFIALVLPTIFLGAVIWYFTRPPTKRLFTTY